MGIKFCNSIYIHTYTTAETMFSNRFVRKVSTKKKFGRNISALFFSREIFQLCFSQLKCFMLSIFHTKMNIERIGSKTHFQPKCFENTLSREISQKHTFVRKVSFDHFRPKSSKNTFSSEKWFLNNFTRKSLFKHFQAKCTFWTVSCEKWFSIIFSRKVILEHFRTKLYFVRWFVRNSLFKQFRMKPSFQTNSRDMRFHAKNLRGEIFQTKKLCVKYFARTILQSGFFVWKDLKRRFQWSPNCNNITSCKLL